MKRCSRCERSLPRQDFCANRARGDGRDVYCRKCKQADRTKREQEYRIGALERLGGECAHCGIDDVRVLCIDHVAGGGGVERRSGLRQITFYKAIVDENIDGYQALCWNCNWLKRLENGEAGRRFIDAPTPS